MLRSIGKLRRFGVDRRGVAALEFALIAPVLILLYFGVGELCEAMMAQRRTAHAASAIGDLTTQSTTLAPTDVSDIFAAASTIMQPFATTTLSLRLTSVTVNSSNTPAIDWSCSQGSGLPALTPPNTYNGLPAGLVSAVGDSIIVAEGQYNWANPVQFSGLQVKTGGPSLNFMPASLPFNEIYYLKPRKSAQVTLPNGC